MIDSYIGIVMVFAKLSLSEDRECHRVQYLSHKNLICQNMSLIRFAFTLTHFYTANFELQGV